MDKMTQEDRIKHYAHLIQRQTGKAVRPYRADGYVNMVNRYGTSKDSSEQYNFVPDAPVADDVLEMHYENNGLFSKIIDMPAEEAIKHGFTIEDVEDGKLADFYSEALDELNWEENAMTAVKWARLFGGSIAIMLVNDGRGLEEPLDWKNIQSIDDIRVYDRSLISPDYSSVFNYDPQDPFRVRGSRLGMPEYYDVYSKYGSFRVHDSRCLVFQNGVLPENATNSIYQFWGIPEYIRLNKAIRDADVAHRSAPKLLERSVQPIYKMKDLAAELATEQGEDRILKRLQVIDTARGILNSLVIDADGEDYDFKTFQYNGITDVISASCNMLAALSNIPQVILFGQTISGMSSTDDTSMENYYNYIERIQKRMLRSNLRYLLSVVFQAGLATGEVDEVPKLKVQFNPLWSVSDSEQATLDQQKAQTEQIKAQTAQIYVGMEAIDPSEVRSKLADSDDFDVENMLDEYTEEELEAGMPSNDESQEQTPADGQPATPDSQPTGNDEKAGPGQLLNEKTLSAVGNNAKYPATMETKVSSDPHENKEGTEGDAPASAPAATKKPSDMDPEEKAKAAQSRQNKAKDREDSLRTDDNNSHSEDQKGSVGVIVVNGGRVLNGTRHNDFGYGLVCGPGGHIEEGETPEQAAFRETKEEFGITPKSLMCLGQGPKEKDTGLKPYLFLCTEYYGTPNCEDLEMTGAKFSTIEELNEKAESLFGPFADGLNILMDCLETGIFYTDPAEGVTDEKLNAHLEKAMNSDGGSGSGNFGHEGRPGKVGGSAESHNFGGLKNSELSSKMNGVFDDAKIGTRFSVKMNGVAGKDDYEIYKVSDGFYVRSKKGGNDIVKSVDKLVENCGVYVTNLTSDKVMYKEANIEVGEPETEEAQSFTRAYESCRKERERLASGNYKITEVDDATAKKYADTLNKASKAKIAKLAMDDPQFKAVVDNISAYTQGEYVYQRKATEKFISNGYDPSNDAILGDRLTDSLYLCKDMYKGQNLSVSSASVTEGMANLTKAVNCSDPFDGELYRVAQDRSLMKTADSGNQGVYTPPKPGETISIVAPTSFSKDKAAIDKIAKDKSGDIIYYTVQPGAHAVDVSKLSPYKQAELLTCGEYEVVSVDSKPQRVVMTQTDRFTSETIDSLKANRGATVDDGFVKFPILETHVTLRQKEPIHMDSCDDSIHRYRPDDFSERMVYDDEIDLDGGPGSGNYGHEGVPGQVGGSAPSTSGPISKSSFQNGSGHFEVTGDVKDMYLTKPARTRIEGAIKTVKTANDLKKYLEDQGIKLETSYEPLKKAMDREIPSIKEQADYVIAAIEQYKDLGGLKALKAVHIYDHDIDAQAQYSYRAKGEGEVPDEGHLYISYMANGEQIMHEFAHAYADSTKPDGMDVVEWSAKLNQEAGLSKNVKAYFGADSEAKEAERFANAMGYAIADGDGPDGRLAFAANVANIVRNSNGSSAGVSGGSLTFKSMIPKDSYFNSSSYNKAVEDFRGAIRKHDEAWKKYRELEKALKSESTPKPESEWDDNDIFEDLIGHRPMAYTEKGKKIKSEMDKAFKDACVYDHEQTETGDKLREIKKKEHDKQVKNIHFQPPADASSDDYEGFTTKTTGTSAYDDYINGERNGGRIAEMSPSEYLQRCAYQVFEDATIESTLAAIDESNVKKYADMMKNGTKFDMPYLNFMSGQQEGRHRAAAAMQAGIDKIPVLVVGERFAKYDGGKGSGNWGHEGRKGKLGGSAPGGGMHNRISEEGGTYTSFSKKQKKLATPHTASAGELDNLPNNTKVVVDTTFGKYSMVYNAKYGAFIGQDGVEMYPKDIEDSFNGDDNKLQVFIPNEASTNYSKLKQSFDVSLSRMASAKSYARPQDADNDLRADTGSVWKTLSDKQKKVLRDYTGSDFSSINYSLRKQRGTKENCDRINDMTAAISKSKTKQDMWLSRGVDFEALPSMFGIKPSNFREDKIGSLVGKSGKDEGFMSCGTTTQTGYSVGSDVDLKIYVPKGSEAMYAEPFARFGSNPESNHWNGESHQSSFSSEMETILQRGSHFQCTKATYDAKEQKYHIEIAVTGQEHKNLDW